VQRDSRLFEGLLSNELVAANWHVAKAFGLVPALILHEIDFWCRKSEDGWCYRTTEELSEKLTLDPSTIYRNRKKLEALGIIETRREGVPARNYYRIDKDRGEEEYLKRMQDAESSSGKLHELDNADCPNSPSISSEKNSSRKKQPEPTTPSPETQAQQEELPSRIIHLGDPAKKDQHRRTLKERHAEIDGWYFHWCKTYWGGENGLIDGRNALRMMPPDRAMMAEITAGTVAWRNSGALGQDGGKYGYHPDTFLSKEIWKEPPPAKAPVRDAYASAVMGEQ
jgi:DNA-binding PadR family transcriptional regulator